MILMSNHVIKIGGRDNLRILEDAFESIVGAIYMDLGLENARSFVLRVVKEQISDEQLFSDDNYKDLLLRYMQEKEKNCLCITQLKQKVHHIKEFLLLK